MLLEKILAEGATIGFDSSEQRPPAVGALARFLALHGGEGGASGVGILERLDAQARDHSVRNRGHLEVTAVVGESKGVGLEAFVRLAEVGLRRGHDARTYNGVLEIGGVSQQMFALVVPRLGHPAQQIDQDRED